MVSLRAIRTRIKSVRNTQKITKALKLVAAAKLRRAQDAVVRTRPYAQALDELLGSLAGARAAAAVSAIADSRGRRSVSRRTREPDGRAAAVAQGTPQADTVPADV